VSALAQGKSVSLTGQELTFLSGDDDMVYAVI